MTEKYKVIGFLARQHGLEGLKHLIESDEFEMMAVFTHKKNPKSEDETQHVRDDFDDYQALCEQHNIPLYAVDSKREVEQIDSVLHPQSAVDLLVSISWRRIIPKQHLIIPNIGGINVHRGKLPDYPGAEPIKQALNNNDNTIEVTAHVLVEEIDAGKKLAVYTHPVSYENNETEAKTIDRLKQELTPCFGPLTLSALQQMIKDHVSLKK